MRSKASAAARPKPSDGVLVAVSAIGTACFLLCYTIAIALYPGGSWFDKHAVGHSFSQNFLCDLMQTRALNGVEAPVGSLLARLGMVSILVALAAFYSQIARLETPRSRAGKVAQWAGLSAAVLGLAVPVATSDQHRDAHIISVVVAFVPSLVATIAALLVCLRVATVPRLIRIAAALTLIAGGIDGLLYAFVYASPLLGIVPASRDTRRLISLSLPFFQRIASIGVLAWLVAVCWHTRSRISQTDSQLSSEGDCQDTDPARSAG